MFLGLPLSFFEYSHDENRIFQSKQINFTRLPCHRIESLSAKTNSNCFAN